MSRIRWCMTHVAHHSRSDVTLPFNAVIRELLKAKFGSMTYEGSSGLSIRRHEVNMK